MKDPCETIRSPRGRPWNGEDGHPMICQETNKALRKGIQVSAEVTRGPPCTHACHGRSHLSLCRDYQFDRLVAQGLVFSSAVQEPFDTELGL
jgi:hypothetical protein